MLIPSGVLISWAKPVSSRASAVCFSEATSRSRVSSSSRVRSMTRDSSSRLSLRRASSARCRRSSFCRETRATARPWARSSRCPTTSSSIRSRRRSPRWISPMVSPAARRGSETRVSKPCSWQRPRWPIVAASSSPLAVRSPSALVQKPPRAVKPGRPVLSRPVSRMAPQRQVRPWRSRRRRTLQSVRIADGTSRVVRMGKSSPWRRRIHTASKPTRSRMTSATRRAATASDSAPLTISRMRMAVVPTRRDVTTALHLAPPGR